jgi:uncharacterized membrane protein YkvA (DUF1232 family)
MGRTMKRTAAFAALWRAVTSAHRGGPNLTDRVTSLPRMAWASLRGEYDGSARFMMMGLATLYVVSPIDALPEVLLGPLGLLDDGVVVAWIVGTFLAETDRFIAWEQIYGRGKERRASHAQQAHQAHRPPRAYEDVVDGEVVR